MSLLFITVLAIFKKIVLAFILSIQITLPVHLNKCLRNLMSETQQTIEWPIQFTKSTLKSCLKLKCQNAVKLTIVSDLFSGAFNLIKAIRLRPESLQNSYFPIKPSVAIVLKYE